MRHLRPFVALLVCELFLFLPAATSRIQDVPQTQSTTKADTTLRRYLQKSYLDLFELAPKLSFGAAEMQAQRAALKKGEDFCVARFKNHAKQYKSQIEAAQT